LTAVERSYELTPRVDPKGVLVYSLEHPCVEHLDHLQDNKETMPKDTARD